MYGADVSDDEKAEVADLFATLCPDAEVEEYDCGQELYYYLIGLE